jgi:multiple sugar transport system ATP-binding protein
VAGFLGSPPMNLIAGHVEAAAAGLVFREARGGPVRVELGNFPGYAALAGKEVTLGIRPEHCEPVRAADAARADAFEALVELVEPMGAETYFYLNTGQHTLISRSHAEADHRGDGSRQRFCIHSNRVHLFDPASGQRVLPQPK